MSELIQVPSQHVTVETHSDLTELPNRRMLEQTLEQLISSGEVDVSLLSIDLDDLKRINDTFGHLEGDRYIINAARVIEVSIRAGGRQESADMVVPSVAELYHRSGDEFYVILRNSLQPNTVVQRLKQNLDDLESRASIGYAMYEPGDTVESFQDRSERALIEDKSKRRYSTFTEAQRSAVHDADVLLASYGLRVAKVDKAAASA